MIHFITFARSYAMVTIVLMHIFMQTSKNDLFQKVISFGGSGVHIFFFLSGFCLMLGSYTNFQAFYRKRFFKIIVPYWIAVSVLFIAKHLLVPNGAVDSWYAYFGHIFLYKMFDERIFYSIGYEFWFLSPLLQFYLLFPIIRALTDKMKSSVLIIVSLSFSVIWWVCEIAFGWSSNGPLSECFIHYLWEFSIGLALARMYKEKGFLFWNMPARGAVIMFVVGYLSVIMLSSVQGQVFRTINDVPLAIGYFGVLVLVYKVSKKLVKPIHDIMINIGELSYYFYLLHGLVMFITFYFAMKTGLPYVKWYAVPLIVFIIYIFSIGYRSILIQLRLA